MSAVAADYIVLRTGLCGASGHIIPGADNLPLGNCLCRGCGLGTTVPTCVKRATEDLSANGQRGSVPPIPLAISLWPYPPGHMSLAT